MGEIILYYDPKHKFRFYDTIRNNIINIDDIKTTINNVNNLWIDYSSFNINNEYNIKTLIFWILKRKYGFVCPFRDLQEIENKEYIDFYKKCIHA